MIKTVNNNKIEYILFHYCIRNKSNTAQDNDFYFSLSVCLCQMFWTTLKTATKVSKYFITFRKILIFNVWMVF